MSVIAEAPAGESYAALAPFYDVLTASYQHDVWLRRLEALALDHGLAGRRLLDVACGTGKSFLPLLGRGYEVTACDISAEMLDVARRRVGADVEVLQADVRSLPRIGPFDLVTWLDDASNCLLGDGDLDRAVGSIATTLAPGGLLIFDVNTLASHRDAFTTPFVVSHDDVFLCWRGEMLDESRPGLPAAAVIEIFEREGDRWLRRQSRHRQRWWSESEVRQACDHAGMELVARYGQHTGAVLEIDADESVHNKIVYFVRKPESAVTGD